MQAILKIAYESDITVYEAQAKYNSLYSSTLKANHTPAPQPVAIPQATKEELDTLKITVSQLQRELKTMKESTIKQLQDDVNKVTNDVVSTNTRLDQMESSIGKGFARLEWLFNSKLPASTTSAAPSVDSQHEEMPDDPEDRHSNASANSTQQHASTRPDGEPQKKNPKKKEK